MIIVNSAGERYGVPTNIGTASKQAGEHATMCLAMHNTLRIFMDGLPRTSGRTSWNAIVPVEPPEVEKMRKCIPEQPLGADFDLSCRDLHIEIPLIRIRGITRVTLCSHEDPGGDIWALVLSCRTLQGLLPGCFQTGPGSPHRGNAFFAAWPLGRLSWSVHGCLRQHANEMKSEAVAF